MSKIVQLISFFWRCFSLGFMHYLQPSDVRPDLLWSFHLFTFHDDHILPLLKPNISTCHLILTITSKLNFVEGNAGGGDSAQLALCKYVGLPVRSWVLFQPLAWSLGLIQHRTELYWSPEMAPEGGRLRGTHENLCFLYIIHFNDSCHFAHCEYYIPLMILASYTPPKFSGVPALLSHHYVSLWQLII